MQKMKIFVVPGSFLEGHDIVHVPPTAIDTAVTTTIIINSNVPGTAPLQPVPAPFSANAGNVVAKAFVGSGFPLTVTVGTVLSGVKPLFEVGLVPEASIENLGEVACITPCVEFMNTRK